MKKESGPLSWSWRWTLGWSKSQTFEAMGNTFKIDSNTRHFCLAPVYWNIRKQKSSIFSCCTKTLVLSIQQHKYPDIVAAAESGPETITRNQGLQQGIKACWWHGENSKFSIISSQQLNYCWFAVEDPSTRKLKWQKEMQPEPTKCGQVWMI